MLLDRAEKTKGSIEGVELWDRALSLRLVGGARANLPPVSFRGRRNLTDFQRTEIALKMKPLIEVKAKENQEIRKGAQLGTSSQNSVELSPIRTDSTVAELAGVSRDTVRKVEKIQQQGVTIRRSWRRNPASPPELVKPSVARSAPQLAKGRAVP